MYWSDAETLDRYVTLRKYQSEGSRQLPDGGRITLELEDEQSRLFQAIHHAPNGDVAAIYQGTAEELGRVLAGVDPQARPKTLADPIGEYENPYWDEVAPYLRQDDGSEMPVILYKDPWPDEWGFDARRFRDEMVEQFAWTISDPESVRFVRKWARNKIVDPMAGTGYWAWLLGQVGVDAVAYDLNPPREGSDANRWHRDLSPFCPILAADAAEAVAPHWDRTLLLSWPPLDFDATPILDAYDGDRVIYMGEFEGGCCGTDGLFAALRKDWLLVAAHVPVRFRLHDYEETAVSPDGILVFHRYGH